MMQLHSARRRASFETWAGGASNDVYRWIEHTGELELFIEAPTQPAVFAEALTAFAELVSDGGREERVRHEIELEAGEPRELLADWLDELVYLADVEAFLPECLSRFDFDSRGLRAVVDGHRGEPRPLVKAVTRHGLALEPGDTGGYRARVVLDV